MCVTRLNSKCLECIADTHIFNVPEGTSEEEKVEYIQRIFKILSQITLEESGPVMSKYISDLQKEMFGDDGRLGRIKRKYNRLMLSKEEEVSKKIAESEDPLYCAILYAMTGNYIDFGLKSKVDDSKLQELLSQAGNNQLDPAEYRHLQKDLSGAHSLIYLTDNCGEIVMDKLLIRQIKEQYPEIDVTVIVRGKEIINDATMKDAREVGLTEFVKVVENGSGIGGTHLPDVNRETKELLEQGDVVISKGMGNYETLQGCGLNIYYIFLCKCDLFVERFGVERLTSILVNDRRAPR